MNVPDAAAIGRLFGDIRVPRLEERFQLLRALFSYHEGKRDCYPRTTTIVARSLIAGVVVFGALLVRQQASSAQQKNVCGPDKSIVGSLEHRTLCFDPRKESLETVRYKIDRFGTDVDLSPLKNLLGDLAAVSKKHIFPDETGPDFLVILAASGAPIDAKRVIASLDLTESNSEAVRLATMLEQFDHDIENGSTKWVSGHLIVHRRDGGMIYVLTRVQQPPIEALFLALDLRENIMDALGLSFAMPKQQSR